LFVLCKIFILFVNAPHTIPSIVAGSFIKLSSGPFMRDVSSKQKVLSKTNSIRISIGRLRITPNYSPWHGSCDNSEKYIGALSERRLLHRLMLLKIQTAE
jgi:hypothetical protein